MKRFLAMLACLALLPLCAFAAEEWALGTWTMVWWERDEVRFEVSEVLGDATGLLEITSDGTLRKSTVQGGKVHAGEPLPWQDNGRMLTVGASMVVTKQADGLIALASDEGVGFYRPATEEEIALLRGGSASMDAAWLLGEWAYVYSEKQGAVFSELKQDGDYVRLDFRADGIYASHTRIMGLVMERYLFWSAEDGVIEANNSPVSLTAEGMLRVENPQDVMYFRRAGQDN